MFVIHLQYSKYFKCSPYTVDDSSIYPTSFDQFLEQDVESDIIIRALLRTNSPSLRTTIISAVYNRPNSFPTLDEGYLNCVLPKGLSRSEHLAFRALDVEERCGSIAWAKGGVCRGI